MNKLISKTRITNILSLSKSLARYRTNPTTYPSSFNKPMNPWDNLDPGRKDNSLVDEFDQ